MRVVVLGATGAVGTVAVPELVAAGHEVIGHARSLLGAVALVRTGARAVRGDADDPPTLRSWVDGADAVVDLRVSVPPTEKAMLPWAWLEYVRLRDRATGTLVDVARQVGVAKVVHDTVTMVYADGGDRLLTESSEVSATGALRANLAAERHLAAFTRSGGVGVALRLAPLYSGWDEFSRYLMRASRGGRAPLLGPPEGWTSALHLDDVGSAVLLALQAPAGVYNVADDEPMRRGDLLALLADAAGAPRVRGLPAALTAVAPAPLRGLARSQRVDTARFRALGWRPHVASRRCGWPAAFATFYGTGRVQAGGAGYRKGRAP